MIDRIKNLLLENDIEEYKITEKCVESCEWFLVGRKLDMDRSKVVRHYKVTLYQTLEHEDQTFKGSATLNVYPTMSDSEINKSIQTAKFAASFVANEPYPLPKPTISYQLPTLNLFSGEPLAFWMKELYDAIYLNDVYEDGGINSCEIFLNQIDVRIVNSNGVDVTERKYEGMIEFITTWQAQIEEIELYRCLNFSDLDSAWISEQVNDMLLQCRDRASAVPTPKLSRSNVILSGGSVSRFINHYVTKCSASAVYQKFSDWRIGDAVQGDTVSGDVLTITLNPFLANSTASSRFDEDGHILHPVTVLQNGVLCNYVANTRYAAYLNVEPTGSIRNVVVAPGARGEAELKQEPHLEVVAFSDFSMDPFTGNFGGEIRLGYYHDGKTTLPVTGGSISGNVRDCQHDLALSSELQQDNEFYGPKLIKLKDIAITGV
ncbi:MAG TPA: peptidase U62 [Firmicutes bacterium]|nr:peptidase U62 [Bacillota bacterium]